MMNRVCCLYRGASHESILLQKDACRNFAKKMGWSVVQEEQDMRLSGSAASTTKPDKLVQIKQQAERSEFDILLVFMFDRLESEQHKTPSTMEWFGMRGLQLWSVYEGKQDLKLDRKRLSQYIQFWQEENPAQLNGQSSEC